MGLDNGPESTKLIQVILTVSACAVENEKSGTLHSLLYFWRVGGVFGGVLFAQPFSIAFFFFEMCLPAMNLEACFSSPPTASTAYTAAQ